MSKKVIIVTVYNSENCGSFLQAYAMQHVLKDRGFEVAFYKRSPLGTSHSFVKRVLSTCKMLLLFKGKHIVFAWKQWSSFQKNCKLFKTCDITSTFYRNAEYVLLGSDTIWNFESSYFRKKSDIYLGTIFKNKKIISYAASAANTSLKLFHKIVFQNGGLSHIDYCMVRDIHTKKLVEKEVSKPVNIVVDPTLLLNKKDYIQLISGNIYKESKTLYLLLYYFGDFNEELKSNILKYAKKRNLKVVSFLSYRKWCDESITADPKKMIFYFNNAEAIVTNTFHGSIFSMIFEKPFAVYDERKEKINDLLIKYCQQKRLFTDATNLHQILEQAFNISEIAEFDLIRERSLDLLYDALDT